MTYNLPTPYHEKDAEIQDRINKMPQECPLCHRQSIMELSYSNESYRDLLCIPTISYDLRGYCRMCRIRWNFSITTD